MTNIIKSRFFLGILASTLVSAALLSTAYAAEITVSTYNTDGDTVSVNSAVLKGVVDVREHPADVWFEYGISTLLGQSTPKNVVGLNFTPTAFDAVINGLAANTTYYFQAVGRNIDTNLEVRGSILSFNTGSAISQNNNNSVPDQNFVSSSAPEVKTNPAISIEANAATLDAYITPNNSNTVAWFEYGTSDSLGTKTEEWRVSVSDYQADFQHKITGLTPNTIYYFRAAARNEYGETFGNNYVFRTAEAYNGITYSQPTVITTPAILVRETSALLNGNVVPRNSATTVWFEWSENPEMNVGVNRNASQSAGAGDDEVYAAYSLTGLTLNKTYYFRVVAQNAYGTTRGNINRFTTAIAPVQTPATPASTSATGNNYVKPQNSDNALALEAEFDNTDPRAGSKAVYGLNYKNISGSTLKDAVLKITLPNEVGYVASSFANVGQDGNVLTFKLGDIAVKGSGVVSIKIKITDLARAQNLKFNAEISYSINGKAGKQSIVNDLQVSEYSLAASVLETLGSLFGNLITIFILGLLIGSGAYHYFFAINKKNNVADAEDPLK